MEENQKVIQLKGLSNNQLLEQFKNIIMDREVQTISLFINFKPKKQNIRYKMEKNLQQKTYEVLNSLKQKKDFDMMFENIRSSFQPKFTQQLTFVQQISKLYQDCQYQQAIKILKPKQTQHLLKQTTRNSKQINSVNLSLNNKCKNRNQYNFITFTIGNCYFRLKNYQQAIDYYHKILQDQPIRQHAQRMNNLGTCYAIKNSFQQALKAYNQAVKIYSQIPQQDMSSLLNNIAMIYLKCDMFKTSQQYFVQSIKQRKIKSPNNKTMLFNSYFNLGICQKKNKKFQQSTNNLFIALNYASDGFGKKIDVYSEICLSYEELQKWSQALSYYQKLSEQYQIQKKPQGTIYERVSKIHQKLGNTQMAAKFAQKAFKIYQQQGNQRKVSEMGSSPLTKMQNTI